MLTCFLLGNLADEMINTEKAIMTHHYLKKFIGKLMTIAQQSESKNYLYQTKKNIMELIMLIGFVLVYFVAVVFLEIIFKVQFNKMIVMLVLFGIVLLIFMGMI